MAIWVDEFMELCPFRVIPTGDSELREIPLDRVRARKGHEELNERRVYEIADEGIREPPYFVEYGDNCFYVLNGHHRVSAATIREQETILANVFQSVQPAYGQSMEEVAHCAEYGPNSAVKMRGA